MSDRNRAATRWPRASSAPNPRRAEFGLETRGQRVHRLLKPGRRREHADQRIIGGVKGRRKSLGGKIQSFRPIKGVEALLPRHSVSVERAAKIEQHRFDCLHDQRPRPATFGLFGAAPGRSNGSPSMNALQASRATLSRS